MAKKHPDSGLFSSNLVPQDVSAEEKHKGKRYNTRPTQEDVEFERRADGQAYRIQPASEVEARFRHGGWWHDRERVRAALVAANVPASRVERFDACGANCVVEYSPSLQKHRIRASYCHDRFCIPCAKSKAKKLADNVLLWAGGDRMRFLTLTLKASDAPLFETLTRLTHCFKKLRDQGFWAKAVRGGCASIEITRGKEGTHWHVHLHALVIGTWIDFDDLKAGWKKATGDSFIVHVRPVEDSERDVSYCTKYATKGASEDALRGHDLLVESVRALNGRRMFITFGAWYGRDEMLCKVQAVDWKRVERLERIVTDAQSGQPYAIAVFVSLGYACGSVNGRTRFCGGKLPWSGP